MLIEVAGKRILTDPGRFGSGFADLTNLDLILITHEHADHLHSQSLETLIKNNPDVTVVTNTSVGKILSELGVSFTVLEGTAASTMASINLKAYDGKHAEIFEDFGQVQNTGYLIADELFYPGDAYTMPEEKITTLALPVAGPWCKLPEALQYAIAVAPQNVFPVHDWLLNDEGIALTYTIAGNVLTEHNITFVPLHNNETKSI